MRRLLIIGCGDVALRTLAYLRARYRIFGLTHDLARMSLLRASGVVPIAGDLDDPASLEGLAGIAHDVLHSAPPPQHGSRLTHPGGALGKRRSPPLLKCRARCRGGGPGIVKRVGVIGAAGFARRGRRKGLSGERAGGRKCSER